MENNNFKKNVQDQLSGLRFQPSGKVWPEVAARLKKEKRRRTLIISWLLLAVLLLGGVLLPYIHHVTEHKNTAQKNMSADPAAATILQDGVQQQESHTPAPADNLPQRSDSIAGTAEQAALMMTAAAQRKKHFPGKTSMHSTPATAAEIMDTTAFIKNTTDNINEDLQGSTVVMPAATAPETTSADIQITADTIVPAIITTDVRDKKNTDTIKQIVSKAVKKMPEAKPWVYSISTDWGLSNIGKGIGMQGNPAGRMIYSNPLSSGIVQGGTAFIPTSFKKGFAFAAGLTASKKISTHLSLQTGLHYQYLTAVSFTGSNYDSAMALPGIATAYRPGNSEKYINQFHFISIPIGLQVRIFSKSRLSGGVNAGAKLMQLISTNAISYDTALKLFYHQSNVFNKTQLAFYAGLQVNYALTKNTIISAGPQLLQGISQAGKRNNYSGQYVKMWALRLSWLLNKKSR